MRRLIGFVSTLLVCGGLAYAKDEDEDLFEPKDFSGVATSAPVEDKNAKIERTVGVSGIVGTMTEFDVRTPLDERSNDFDRCHDQYGGSGGKMSFKIHVLSDGKVGQVKAYASHVKKDVAACYKEVVSSTQFPTPHGGYADVKWQTKVGRAKKKRDSDLYDRDPSRRWDAPGTGVASASTTRLSSSSSSGSSSSSTSSSSSALKAPVATNTAPAAAEDDEEAGLSRRERRHRREGRHGHHSKSSGVASASASSTAKAEKPKREKREHHHRSHKHRSKHGKSDDASD